MLAVNKQQTNQSFAKKYRIVKPAQYKFIFNKPKRVIDNNFIVIAKNNKENFPRLGLAISKKSIKLAVQRNRIKRLIREYFRQELITTDQCIDFVVMAKNNIHLNSNEKLLYSLNKNFKKLINQLIK
jgi:ribonuclease P protein component